MGTPLAHYRTQAECWHSAGTASPILLDIAMSVARADLVAGLGVPTGGHIGHFFIAIDPELFMPAADFTARVDRLIDQLEVIK